ncbi:MAG: hypothetical protein ACK4SY_06795 [Pyrobaculum sp.]
MSVLVTFLVVGIVYAMFNLFSGLTFTFGNNTIQLIPPEVAGPAKTIVTIMFQLLLIAVVVTALLPFGMWLWDQIRSRR